MTEPEHFPNAPIVEALLDIAVVLPETVDQEKLASFQERLGKRYPNKQVRHSWSAEVQLRPGALPETRGTATGVGYLFTSQDGKQVVQVRKDGFSFSRLKPYEKWDLFSQEARGLWSQYVSTLKPTKVIRAALRFINRIELPLPFADFKEYLLTTPEIAPGLPQSLSSFFFRVVIPDERAKALAIITETIEEAEVTKGKLPVIFDIDVFRTGSFPTDAEKLWPMFAELRELKDRIFFESLTDKAKDLFR